MEIELILLALQDACKLRKLTPMGRAMRSGGCIGLANKERSGSMRAAEGDLNGMGAPSSPREVAGLAPTWQHNLMGALGEWRGFPAMMRC